MAKSKFSPYEIFTKLMSLGKSMRSHCHRAIESDGFTMNETDVLLALLSADDNNTVKAISESSTISKGNISQAVESLKKKGYITTETSSEDRRSVTITLTDKAAPVVEKLQNAEEDYFNQFMVTLSKGEASLVKRIFSALQNFSIKNFLNKLSKKEHDYEEKN
ncbi:MAG: winged helix-turn-helix transcriptional regulator [Clostridia bacterium]|nr:winged helix-turn-helix transcriptional regulator [Clostridia bacterium]